MREFIKMTNSNHARKINVALAGYGFVGKTFHAPLINAVNDLNLHTVISSDANKVQQDLDNVAVVAEFSQAVQNPEIDLVVLATPNNTHAPLAKIALEAGKHVVIDKPFTLDMAEARATIELANRQKRLLSVFHNRRWDSDFLAIAQVVQDKTIGEIRHFESHFDRFRPEVKVRWREQNIPGSGLWFDLGPHLIDQALQLFGLPESVQANIATLRPNAEIDDWAHVILNYPQHKVILHGSMLVAGGEVRFVLHGIKGSAIKIGADPQEKQLLSGVIPGSAQWGVDEDTVQIFDSEQKRSLLAQPRGDHREYYRLIAAAIRGESENPVTPMQALAVMAVLEAANTSQKTGKTCGIDLTETEKSSFTRNFA
jgi:predicted dehydrogenase